MYPTFLQTDKRWKSTTFSASKLTIERWGCAICSIANLLNFYKKTDTPDVLAKKLEFTPDGAVKWASVSKNYPDIQFKLYTDCSAVSAPLDKIDAFLAQDIPVIVATRMGIGRKQEHWVILWKKWAGEYLCSDPLNGEIFFKDKYGDPKRWIYKIVVYNKI